MKVFALSGAVVALGSWAWIQSVQPPRLPASAATAEARLNASPRHGEWATVKVGGDSIVSWVVYPERPDRAPVVVVIHENSGLTSWARAVADQLAAEGFIAIAPELLTMRRRGNLMSEWSPDSGRAASGTISNDQVQRWIDAVARYGTGLPSASPRYGVVGFSWGGARAFLHAAHAPGLGAAVAYYGSPPSAAELGSIRAPVLGLYGGADARISTTVPATEAAMKKAGKRFEFAIYPGAGPGFLRGQDGQDGANLKATTAAWPKTIAFLKARLEKPAGR